MTNISTSTYVASDGKFKVCFGDFDTYRDRFIENMEFEVVEDDVEVDDIEYELVEDDEDIEHVIVDDDDTTESDIVDISFILSHNLDEVKDNIYQLISAINVDYYILNDKYRIYKNNFMYKYFSKLKKRCNEQKKREQQRMMNVLNNLNISDEEIALGIHLESKIFESKIII
jgi:hypothetical protein